MTSRCNCTIKNNFDVINLNFDLYKYKLEKENQNFKMIKCTNAFSSLKDNLDNYGFWIFSILMLLNIIFLILTFLNMKPFQAYLNKEMAKKGYIEKVDEGHAFCHNYIKKLDKLIIRLNQMKNNFKEKKEAAPPKHKVHKIDVNDQSIRKNFLQNKNKTNKKIKGQKDLENDLERLKSRMDKTKRFKYKNKSKINVYNTKDRLVSEKIEKTQNNADSEKEDKFKINLINININDLKKKVYIPQESKHILNIYNYEEALKYEKRSLINIYYIFLIAKQAIMHAIFYRSPIEPLPLRLSILKLLIGCDLALNAIFYTDKKIYEKYKSGKNAITFAFTNFILIILLSFLIGFVLLTFLMNLNNSTNEIRRLFRGEEEKIKKDSKYKVNLQRKKEILVEIKKIITKFKIKVIIYYIIEFLIMSFYWYYVTIFCYIYKKTQISWIIVSIISIIIRIIFDLIINFIFAVLYNLSISSKCKCLFNFMVNLYCFA